MKNQALFPSKDKGKKFKCHLANFWEEIFGGGGGGGGGGGAHREQFIFESKFSREEILGTKLCGEVLVRRKFCQQKYFGNFCK